MTYFSVDVESDGPIPGDYSMTEFGAVVVRDDRIAFHGLLKPISGEWIPEALAVSNRTREEVLEFPDPYLTMTQFVYWVAANNEQGTRPIFLCDNAYDWMFMAWYLHHFTGDNPFGWSARIITDVWHGMQKDMRASFKHLRISKHTHNPVDDARGNAEAFLQMTESFGLKVNL